MDLSASDWKCPQTLPLGQEMNTPPATDGGIRLKSYQYRHREPWTCLAGRRDADYDIHWEPKPIDALLGSKSPSKRADAPRSPHPTGKPSCYISDVPVTAISPIVEGKLDVGGQQEQGRLEAGVGNGGCIIGNGGARPDMETIENPFAAEDVAICPGDSSNTTMSTKIGTVDKSDTAITTTLNDRENLVHNAVGGAEESVKPRSRLRRRLGNTAVSRKGNGDAIPDARAVWVRQQLAISDAHNLVLHSTCKEEGSKTADDADNPLFSSTKDGERPISTARDRDREAQVRGCLRMSLLQLGGGEKNTFLQKVRSDQLCLGRARLMSWVIESCQGTLYRFSLVGG